MNLRETGETLASMDLHIYTILLLSLGLLAGDSMANGLANFSCMPQSPVCDGEEVVCSCTADCDDTIHWWNGDVYFCTATVLNGSSNTTIPGSEPPVRLEVTNDCPSGTFTSRSSFNASLDAYVTNNTDTRIGCFVSIHEGGNIFNGNCTPIREPLGPERNYNTTLSVTNCTVPNPPRNLMTENNVTECESQTRTVTFTWEPPLSPVTCYNISCTSTDGDGSCSELLPANTTSFTLSVDAGVQYTFMVSALVDDRESQNSPTVDFVAVKFVNGTSSENNATIWLQVGDITSNLAITYRPCSESSSSYTTVQFMTPMIQLVNLTAETMYCYSISATDPASNTTVVGSCNGTFTTEAPPGGLLGLLALLVIPFIILVIAIPVIICVAVRRGHCGS